MTLKPIAHVLVIVFLAAMLPILPSAQATGSSNFPAAANLDLLVERAVEEGAVGISVAIDRGGELLYAKGFGLADVEQQVPVTRDSVFRIASVTKQFTAAACLKLIEQGDLELEDELVDLLPDYPAHAQGVSLHHLLNHTSGIPSYTNLENFSESITLDLDHEAMLAKFADLPLEFDPGTDFRYNNSGYYLLGMIIEETTGQSYDDALRALLFDPLELDSMQLSIPRRIVPRRVRGYTSRGDQLANAQKISMTQPFAAGALLSNAADLTRWTRALVEHRALSAESFESMTTPVPPEGSAMTYGYGLIMFEEEGGGFTHSGGINGFSAELAYYEQLDLTIALLCNSNGANLQALRETIFRVIRSAESSSSRE